jgi:transcription elongation factor Elf1
MAKNKNPRIHYKALYEQQLAILKRKQLEEAQKAQKTRAARYPMTLFCDHCGAVQKVAVLVGTPFSTANCTICGVRGRLHRVTSINGYDVNFY